ncbi:hypothetical protein Tco_0759065, partial [Tanacetum coccineum]
DLKTNHPFHPALSLPHIPIDHHHPIASSTVVLDRIKSFPRGTSCGRDGLRAQHLMDCLSGAAVAVSDELVSSITQVVNLFLAGNCPWERISEKRTTNQAKTDKTEHEIEKREKTKSNRSQSQESQNKNFKGYDHKNLGPRKDRGPRLIYGIPLTQEAQDLTSLSKETQVMLEDLV